MDDNKLLDFIRQHSNYLTPTTNLDIFSFAAVVVRSMIMSLFVYFSFLTIAITAGTWFTLSPAKFRALEYPEAITEGAMVFVGNCDPGHYYLKRIFVFHRHVFQKHRLPTGIQVFY